MSLIYTYTIIYSWTGLLDDDWVHEFIEDTPCEEATRTQVLGSKMFLNFKGWISKKSKKSIGKYRKLSSFLVSSCLHLASIASARRGDSCRYRPAAGSLPPRPDSSKTGAPSLRQRYRRYWDPPRSQDPGWFIGDCWLGMVGYGWVWLAAKIWTVGKLAVTSGPYLDKRTRKDWVCCCSTCYMYDEVSICGWHFLLCPKIGYHQVSCFI